MQMQKEMARLKDENEILKKHDVKLMCKLCIKPVIKKAFRPCVSK